MGVDEVPQRFQVGPQGLGQAGLKVVEIEEIDIEVPDRAGELAQPAEGLLVPLDQVGSEDVIGSSWGQARAG